MKLTKSETESTKAIVEIEQSSARVETFLHYCTASIDDPTMQKQMTATSEELLTLVKQLLTYALYNQPLQEVLDNITKRIKALVLCAQRETSLSKERLS